MVPTPSKLKIALLEKIAETGRPMILLHSEDGDIFVSAPNGRIHVRNKYYREIWLSRRNCLSLSQTPLAASPPAASDRG